MVGLPAIEDVFRKTGEVCLERTLRIQARNYRRFNGKDSGSVQENSKVTLKGDLLQQRRNEKLQMLKDI